MSEEEVTNAQFKSLQHQQMAQTLTQIQSSNGSTQKFSDQSPTTNQSQSSNGSTQKSSDQSRTANQSQSSNQKWQKIISEQAEEQSTPFILKQQSFKSQNQAEQLSRQQSMMQQTAKNGRQLLKQQKYQEASKQLSKTLMAFQFIAKNNALTIQKQILKSMMIETVLPAYNNLALCYLKLKNFQLVVSFTNQILAQDDANVKARYRRALASKEMKNTEQAIKDFQIVKKLDSQMINDCDQRIKQCKLLQIEIRKKRKQAAQKFISGYQSDDIRPKNKQENQSKQDNNLGKQRSQMSRGLNWIDWVRQKCQKCSKMLQKLRPGAKEASEKSE